MKKYVKYLVVAVVLTLVFYITGSLIYSSAYEHRLAVENKLCKELYPQMLSRAELIKDAIAEVQYKDDRIHNELFGTDSPDIRNLSRIEIYAADNIPEQKIQTYISEESLRLADSVAAISRRFEDIYARLSGSSVPPMLCPIEDVSYSQIGASTGEHYNPIYKMEFAHRGLDIITNIGTDVRAAAAGTVTDVGHSIKSNGNTVEIRHEGGYVTRYMHLTDIKVRRGQSVKAGDVIASVGMSGATYLPHLHYEVEKDGVLRDPSDYLFASFDPEEYEKVLYMTRHTVQTLD